MTLTRSLLYLLLVLLGVVLCGSLGVWQLHRAAFKQNLQQHYETRRIAPPISLSQWDPKTDQAFYRLRIRGHYDVAHPVIVINKIYQHRLGFYVLLPFFPQGKHVAILVNQGWMPEKSVTTIAEKPWSQLFSSRETTIVGLIQYPKKSFMLGENIIESRWPLQVQQIDLPVLSARLQTPFYPFVLLLSPQTSSGFVRAWAPVNLDPRMHQGYAVQWFTMGFALFLFYIVRLFLKK